MNNLSLFIYLADVIPTIGGFFAVISIFSFILSAGSIIGIMVSYSDMQHSIQYDMKHIAEKEKKMVQAAKKLFYISMTVFCISSIPATFIPKHDTIMMIAASEFGESALKSDDVQEIVNPAKKILKNWINDQLAQTEKKK